MVVRPSRSRAPVLDPACADAVTQARAAVEELAGSDRVGDHQGAVPEGDRVVTHYFTCLDPAYRGWRWAVTVARAARSKTVTVSESVLVPGDEALLAPRWLPWRERVRPEDLRPGDILPTRADDPRLAPGFTETRDDADRQLVWELGLGRARVLSAVGRDAATERWYTGVAGPSTPLARAAPGQCSTCGFYIMLAGALRQLFGVCANELSPDDGRVVAADHGCGAHSEAGGAEPSVSEPPASPVVDEFGYDLLDTDGEAEPGAGRPGHD